MQRFSHNLFRATALVNLQESIVKTMHQLNQSVKSIRGDLVLMNAGTTKIGVIVAQHRAILSN